MHLRTWLLHNHLTVKEFSQKLRIHKNHLSNMMRNTRNGSKSLQLLILILTKGEVKPIEILDPDVRENEPIEEGDDGGYKDLKWEFDL